MARTELPNGVILPAEYSDDWYEDMTSNLTKLDDVIGSDSEKLNADGVYFLRMSSAALTDSGTGNFSDLNSSYKVKTGDLVLDSGRKLYRIVSVDSTNETFTVGTSLFKVTAESDLAPVAESGDYGDLDNRPDLNPYDQHLANTEIHVTAADKQKWNNGVAQSYVLRYSSTAITDNSTIAYSTLDNTDNIKADDKIIDVDGKIFSVVSVDSDNSTVTVGSALIDLALDANVMHLSGDETAAGIKTFSDDTYIKSLNFTNEVPSQSGSSSSIMPMIVTITYGDSSPSVQARLNFRITADGTKSFYPNENNQYSLGLLSRRWSSIFGYFVNLGGVYLGNEASTNQRTNLYLLANRDTDGQSGCYVTRYRQNKAQGTLAFSDQQQIGIDFLENSVRTNNLFNIVATDWTNDVPGRILINSGIANNSFGSVTRKCLINELNPGVLSFPNLDNGLDISGYLDTSQSSINTYTPVVAGWISIKGRSSATSGVVIIQDGMSQVGQSVVDFGSSDRVCFCALPVKAGVQVTIWLKSVTSLDSAKFFPCQGNV